MPIETAIPPRRYLNRVEAAAWLGVGVDTFDGLKIPFFDLGPRSRRWDVVDIISFMEDTLRCDSARTSDKRRRQPCDSTNEKTHLYGGSRGSTRTESDIAEVLELTTGS